MPDNPERPLTAKQRRWIELYCTPGTDCYNNGAESARQAGYSARTAHAIGRENLHKPALKKAIEAKRAEITERSQITADETISNARWLIDYGKRNGKPQAVQAGNDQLAKIAGQYTDNKQGTSMPTINFQLTEPKEDRPQLRIVENDRA